MLHFQIVKHILRLLILKVTRFVESTSGIIFFLGVNAVTWQSQKQKIGALSLSQPRRRHIKPFGLGIS